MRLFLLIVVPVLLLVSSIEVRGEGKVDSIYKKDRPLYDPLGIKMGVWKFKPAIKLDSIYDDNILSSAVNKESDIISVISPKLSLESDWNRHSLSFHSSAKIAKYNDNNSENYEDIHLKLLGKLDILRNIYVKSAITYEDVHEDRGSREDDGGLDRTTYSILSQNATFYHDVGRVSFRLGEQIKQYNYSNTALSSGILDNSHRDRNHYVFSSNIGYRFSPDYVIFIDGRFDARRYKRGDRDNRDSNGFEVSLGLRTNVSGKVKGGIRAGFLQRSYDGPLSEKTDGFKANGHLVWNITSITSLLAGGDISVKETTLSDSTGFIASGIFVGIEHELLDNLLLKSKIDYTKNEYQGGGSSLPDDDIYDISAGISYLWNRNLNFEVKYNYVNRQSNISSSDYENNRILFGLSLAY